MRIVTNRDAIGQNGQVVHIVYHDADLDGVASAAVVLYMLRYHGLAMGMYWARDAVMLHGMDYGRAFAHEAVRPGDTVYMVDFSLPPEQMDRLWALPDRTHTAADTGLVWYDHHATAIEACRKDILGRRDTTRAACEIVAQELLGYVPMAIQLMGRWDVWDHGAMPGVREFQYGCRLEQLLPTNRIWDKLLRPDEDGCQANRHALPWIRKRVREGTVALRYAEQVNRRTVTAGAYLMHLDGYVALACNAAGGSDLFRDAPPELLAQADVLLTHVYSGRRREWVCGLYHRPGREDVDCGALARKHGGGGHRGAAGFRSASRLLFCVAEEAP